MAAVDNGQLAGGGDLCQHCSDEVLLTQVRPDGPADLAGHLFQCGRGDGASPEGAEHLPGEQDGVQAVAADIPDDHPDPGPGGDDLIQVTAEPDIEVAGEAADGEQAVAAALQTRPDVVLMDIRMPVLDGIEATRRLILQLGATRVVMLTTFDLDDYVVDAFRAGASGFLLKTAPPPQLVAAIRTVHAGDGLLAPASTRRLIEQSARPPAPAPALGTLTAREHDVLRLLARGLTNAEIAAELVVEPSTVKSHVASLLAKLNLRDRVQAVVFAYESGLVHPGTA
jgi:DNA-binding NarL/FixJ family response regulator